MGVHCAYPAESLTWDDVCQLWDNGVYTAEEVKSIATLYFEGAELTAVIEVIENVENESQTLEAMNTDPDYIKPGAPANRTRCCRRHVRVPVNTFGDAGCCTHRPYATNLGN
jgi:hypothetical protein